MEVKTVNAGLRLLLDFSHDGGRSAGDQLGLDAETLLDTFLNVLSQLGAGGDRDDNLSFLLGGLNDLVPFTLCRLPGFGPRNIAAQDEPA